MTISPAAIDESLKSRAAGSTPARNAATAKPAKPAKPAAKPKPKPKTTGDRATRPAGYRPKKSDFADLRKRDATEAVWGGPGMPALKIKCPRCEAPAHAPCVEPAGIRCAHKARLDAVKK